MTNMVLLFTLIEKIFKPFIEIKIDSSSRLDLGRPEDSPLEQKRNFQKKISD